MRSAALALAVALFGLPSLAAAAPNLELSAPPAGHYVLDPHHASVIIHVPHMGLSHVAMRFDQIAGQYDYDPAHPLDAKLAVTIDAHSLDTGDPAVSKQFAGEFLDADKAPQITFASTAVQPSGPGHGAVTGDLTFRGVTRPVSLDVTYNGYASEMIGGKRMGFSATGVIKRSDFGSKAWLGPVGDDVQLTIEAEFQRK